MQKLIPFLTALLFVSPSLLLAQQTLTGRVISSQGEVTVLSADRERVQAATGQAISVSDEIETGVDGLLQIRFSSGLLLSLDCRTSLQLEPGITAGREVFNLTLRRGQLRLITGEQNTVIHYLRTDAGLLAIDTPGADLAIARNPGPDMFAAVYKGSARARTNAGEMVLGVGGDFDFAALEPGNEQAGLQNMPARLGAQSNCR